LRSDAFKVYGQESAICGTPSPLLSMRRQFLDLNGTVNSSQLPFLATLKSLGFLECSDPRNQVFGLLGLFKGLFDYDADYTKTAEGVFMGIMEYLVSTDNSRGLIHVFGVCDREETKSNLEFFREALKLPAKLHLERRKLYRTLVKLADCEG
jgi:hypothetical protein